MRLLDLEPSFVRYEDKQELREFAIEPLETWRERGCPSYRKTVTVSYLCKVGSISEAQGVRFLCPVCFAKNGGAIGTHGCEVSFEGRGVLPYQGSHNKEGKPVRWNAFGTGLHDLTLTPSILLEGGCAWHGYITNGQIS